MSDSTDSANPPQDAEKSPDLQAVLKEIESLRSANEKAATSIAALENKNRELLDEKRRRTEDRDKALAEQGKFEELYRQSAATLEESAAEIAARDKRIAELSSVEAQFMGLVKSAQESFSARFAKMTEDHRELYKELYPSWESDSPFENQRRYEIFAEKIASAGQKGGLGAIGAGHGQSPNGQQLHESVKTGNFDQVLRHFRK